MFKRASRLAALALALAAAGCAGSDGAAGPQGPAGSTGGTGGTGPTGPGAMAVETCVLCHGTGQLGEVATAHGAALPTSYNVTVNTVDFDATFTSSLAVNFTVLDGATAVTNVTTSQARFTIAALQPAAGGGGVLDWVTFVPSTGGRPTTETTGALTHNGAGNYTYLFKTDIKSDPKYDATKTHRLAIQISGTGFKATNATADFILATGYPAGATVTDTRDVVLTAACNDCHERLGVNTTTSLANGFHSGGRYETKYCVVCHNPGRAAGRTNTASAFEPSSGTTVFPAGSSQYIADGEILGDLTVLVHKIHKGHELSKGNYNYAGVAFNHITYPQEVNVCGKCHKGTDGANWNVVPSRKACGACHDDVNFVTGVGHPAPGGIRTNDNNCAGCHDATAIQGYHNTHHATANNPADPNADEFAYAIGTVTANAANRAVVTFRITRNGAAFDPFNVDTSRFSGNPSFLVAYALPQDDVASPVDYNNAGRAAAQPATVAVNRTTIPTADRVNNGDGSFTVTLPASSAFPAGAKLRAVALQGYYTQLDIDPVTAGNQGSGRYTRSVMKAVTGDTVRRTAVNESKCLKCHETLQLHGGNRVDNPQVCVMCHNPNLTSSGRGADPALITTSSAVYLAYGGNPLAYPEASNNLKDMVHGLHGAGVRNEKFEFVRDRGASGVFPYDWSEVTYPARIFNCQMCHDAGQYGVELPAGVLMSNLRTTTGNPAEVRADVLAARGAVPNGTDDVVNATAAACSGCHDSALGKAHMDQNGAGFDTRDRVLQSK